MNASWVSFSEAAAQVTRTAFIDCSLGESRLAGDQAAEQVHAIFGRLVGFVYRKRGIDMGICRYDLRTVASFCLSKPKLSGGRLSGYVEWSHLMGWDDGLNDADVGRQSLEPP